jgi:two-component system chemotaxis sensor kinase CheA
MTREAAIVEQTRDPLTAFRYSPDADCFFRGEDPLAVVEALPLLEALAILPAQGAWPSGDDLDPFACFSVIEGLSKASEAELRTAFRLQPDQVEFAVITPCAETGEAGASPRETTLLRVEAARIDTLADGLAQLVITTNGLAAIAEDLEAADPFLATRLRTAQADVERIATTLHGDLAQLRLVTLEPALRRLPRAAREIAQALGKDVAFTIEGEAVEADKQIAEGLFEPLLHLMRNAIDHGIEAPDLRRSLGKPVQGQIRLVLAREGKAITATISDDGRGIDPVRLRHLAVERGLLSDTQAEALDDKGALRLIFHPGFSTAGTVTDLSGRGVGMDAVQAAVTRLRGSIRIESTQGTGTRFCMVFPGHALTTRLLVIRLGTECFGVSLDQVVETARIATSAIRSVGTGQACVLRGETVPVLDLAAMLDLASMDDPVARLIITRVDGHPVALRVHGFAQRIDTVLRPPRGMLARTHGIMGSALLGDGGVLLVLDLAELAA